MNINISKKDIIWGYVGTIMSLTANVIILPFLIKFLDGNQLGLWYVFVSIGALTSLFDFGFSLSFARNITYCWSGAKQLTKENALKETDATVDYRMFRDVLETCKYVYLVISVVALIGTLSIGTLYINSISAAIDKSIYFPAWIIYAVSMFLNLYYGYYASFLRGVGDVEDANKNTVYARIVHILLTIVLLYCGFGLIGACIGYLSYGFTFRLLGKYKFYRYKHIGENLKKVEGKVATQRVKELFSIVWHNAWKDGIVSLSNYLSNQISTIICSLYLTLAETGEYSLGVQIAMALSTVSAALYSTYQPELQASYVRRDKDKLQKTMSLIVVSYIGVFLIGLIALLTVGLPVLSMLKPDITLTFGSLLGLCLYQFILKFRNCYASYFSCTNRLPYVKSFLFAAIMCIDLSYLALGPLTLGIPGLVAAQIFSQVIYNAWKWAFLVYKELEFSFFDSIIIGTKEVVKLIKLKRS